jgi:outer membrane protein assembly factor BamD (BamD/ComL family)
MNRLIIIIAFIAAACGAAVAGERDILDTAQRFYEGGDYYSAITEAMRYQCLYPAGTSYARSMLLMGKAYYRGNNFRAALGVLVSCGRGFAGSLEGEEALYLAGYIQLVKGNPAEAASASAEYRKRYPDGRFIEETERDACFSAALSRDLPGSAGSIRAYREKNRQGRYLADLDRLERTLADEKARPRRHLWLSVLGSAVVPGFGHFYTGHYGTGVLTLLSNALFIFMICNGAMMKNTFQVVIFSLAEAVVYQYNIISSVRVIDEFNRARERDFTGSVRLGLTASF